MDCRANWCLLCLRPIEEGDRDVAVLLANSGSADREILVHGHCDRVRRSPRRDDTATVHRSTSGSPNAADTSEIEIIHVGPSMYATWSESRPRIRQESLALLRELFPGMGRR